MFSIVFCLSFLPCFLVCNFVPFGYHMDAKEVQKRPQGHPFGQQKLTKLDLDQRCQEDGKHAFSMIGVREIEATFYREGGLGGEGAVHALGG